MTSGEGRQIARRWSVRLVDGRELIVPDMSQARVEQVINAGLALRTAHGTVINGQHVVTAEALDR